VKVVLLCLHLLSLVLAAISDKPQYTRRAVSLPDGAVSVAVFEESAATDT
jgi:hypothetical protein